MKTEKILIVLALAVILIFPLLIVPRILKIEEITCKSQFGQCNSILSEKLAGLTGKNYYDLKKEIKSLFDQEALVEEYSFQFKLPNRLEVGVLEKKSRYGLKNKGQTAVFLIDSEGNVTSKVESASLPVLEMETDTLEVGRKVGQKTLFTLQLLSDLFTFYDVRTGKIDGDGFKVKLPEGYGVIFPLKGDRQVLIGSLLLVLQQLNSEEQNSKIEKTNKQTIIDLRYKNPVIRDF